MSNPIFSFVITAKKDRDLAGKSILVSSCTNNIDAKKVAIGIAKSKWPETTGWRNHDAKQQFNA